MGVFMLNKLKLLSIFIYVNVFGSISNNIEFRTPYKRPQVQSLQDILKYRILREGAEGVFRVLCEPALKDFYDFFVRYLYSLSQDIKKDKMQLFKMAIEHNKFEIFESVLGIRQFQYAPEHLNKLFFTTEDLKELYDIYPEQTIKILKNLLKKGDAFQVGIDDCYYFMNRVINSGDLEAIDLLIKKGVDLNRGPISIVTAVVSGKKDMVELFLQRGARLHLDLALKTSLESGRFEIAEMLVASGAKFNLSDFKENPRVREFLEKNNQLIELENPSAKRAEPC